jgi:hypothetical protein
MRKKLLIARSSVLFAILISVSFTNCSSAYKILHCHKPVIGNIWVIKNIRTMVLVRASVSNTKESWFECWKEGESARIKSNHEHREGMVVGEFVDLSPDTEYIFGVFATNRCGEASIVAVQRFRTPPPLR